MGGRKLWRVITSEAFASAHAQMGLANQGEYLNNSWVNAEVQMPFDSWSANSTLHSLNVDIYEGVLEPGEVLYIPPGAPHAARTLEQWRMVAYNDQTLQSIREIKAYCRQTEGVWLHHTGRGTMLCIETVKKSKTIEDNYVASEAVQRDMSFAQSFGCENAIAYKAEANRLKSNMQDAEYTGLEFAWEFLKLLVLVLVVFTVWKCGAVKEKAQPLDGCKVGEKTD